MRREVDPDVYCPQAALVDEETALRTERRLARYRAKVVAAKDQEKMMALRQQRMWVWATGGALVAVTALGLIWYKHYSSRGRMRRQRRRGGGGGAEDRLPRDLFLDEDDGFDGTEEELQQVFDEAAKAARKLPEKILDDRDRLMLYGLYKQARQGDRDDDNAPSKLNVVAYAKYDAWGKFKGLPKQFAMKKYCEVVYHFSKGGESSYGVGERDDNNVDVIYDDDKQQRDVDEDGCPVNISGKRDWDDLGVITGMGMRPSTLSGILEAKSQTSESKATAAEVRLRDAAIANDVASLKDVIKGECDIDDTDEAGLGALHLAADRGSSECLKVLVEIGANVNAVDCDGISVLHTALIAGLDVESLQILLEAGADPDHCDDDGESPRMWVSEEGDKDVVDLFALFLTR